MSSVTPAVGQRVTVDWGDAGWREGICVDVQTELPPRGPPATIYRVEYDEPLPGGGRSATHGRSTDLPRDARLVACARASSACTRRSRPLRTRRQWSCIVATASFSRSERRSWAGVPTRSRSASSPRVETSNGLITGRGPSSNVAA